MWKEYIFNFRRSTDNIHDANDLALAAAAHEIKDLITSSVEKIDSGSRQAADAGRIVTEIVQSVGKVEQYMGQISNASKEQSCGIEQINSAVAHIDVGFRRGLAADRVSVARP